MNIVHNTFETETTRVLRHTKRPIKEIESFPKTQVF